MSERDDHEFFESGNTITCMRCDGEGFIVNCCDDICHGQGRCMHGDNDVCPDCHGEGEISE